MKSHLISLISILLFIANHSYGQQIESSSRFYLRLMYGHELYASKIELNTKTDNLIGYSEGRSFMKATGSYFINSNWGFELAIQLSLGNKLSNRIDNFESEVEQAYQDQYYVRANSNHNGGSNGFTRVLGSLAYRKCFSKLIFIPKIGLGITDFRTDQVDIRLKEKGSNNVNNLLFKTTETNRNFLTLSANFEMSYKISRLFGLSSEVQYTCFSPKFSYSEELRNMFTENVSSSTYDYSTEIHTLSIGLGIFINF